MVKETCLCGVSVHKATLIVGIISLIGSILMALGALGQVVTGKTPATHTNSTGSTSFDKMLAMYDTSFNAMPSVNLVIAIVNVVITILLIYGNRIRKAEYYWPFLVIMVIDLVLGVLVTVGLFGAMIICFVSPSTMGFNSEEGHVAGVAYLILFVLVAIVYLLHFYFYFLIPNRSRQLLVEEHQALGGVPISDKQPVI